ncbi:MAG: polysaccharide deacetylase family protein [Parabacteroides merdae]
MSGKIRQKEKVAYLSFDDGWQSNLNLIPIIDKYQAPITIFVSIDPLFSGNFWWEYALADGIELRDKMKLMSYKNFVSSLESLKKKYSLERSVLTEQELVKIASHPLVSIQSHTMSHPILTNCDDEILSYELNSSKAYLENLLHHKIEAFSYPNGNFSNREIEAVKKAGYKMAFTTEYTPIQINHTNLYRIPRMAMNTCGGYYENLSKILGIWQSILKR